MTTLSNSFIEINSRISYIKSSENPLSSDVYLIRGNSCNWIFDVGSNANSLQSINNLNGKINVVISHFHEDHMANLDKIEFNELFVSKNTYKYTKRGTIVCDDLYLDDGIKLHIFPLPSSHAKGCLALEIDDEYVFLGDAIYPKSYGEVKSHNPQILFEEIKKLERCNGNSFLLSHDRAPIVQKDVIIKYLKTLV